jgi:hypothetical protein
MSDRVFFFTCASCDTVGWFGLITDTFGDALFCGSFDYKHGHFALSSGNQGI